MVAAAAWLWLLSLPALAHPVAQASPAPTPGTGAEGPPWTYQMARLGIFLIVVVAIMIGLAYRRFVLVPQKRLQEQERRRRSEAAAQRPVEPSH